jgi:hypothetical protein
MQQPNAMQSSSGLVVNLKMPHPHKEKNATREN